MSKLILISVKEQYVKEMLAGRKTIELRKAKPNASPGDLLIIYTTHPKKAITAVAVVSKIITNPPSEMWEQHHKRLGIDKASFDAYYRKSSKAVGIEFSDITPLSAEILLSAIKLLHPRFSPPQTFKYLNKFGALRDFRNLLA